MNYKPPEYANDKQKLAITSGSDNIAIVAVPGSGKTFCLQHRVDRLIQEGVDPCNILAVTFTNKAAKELKDRIHNNKVFAITFHGLAYQICTEAFGKLTIYDEDDVKRCAKKLGIIVPKGTSPIEYLSIFALDAPDCPMTRVADIEKYDAHLAECEAIDFDRMIERAIDLLSDRNSLWNNKFDHILIDEYQDIDCYQQKLIDLLYTGKLFVIGDPNQCIYESFRYAEPSFMLNFADRYKNAEVISLDVNYRSDSKILGAASKFIGEHGPSVSLISCSNETGIVNVKSFSTQKAQAEHVIKSIRTRHGVTGVPYCQMVVLGRTASSLLNIEKDIKLSNIPYKMKYGISISERAVLKDIVAFYRLKQNQKDFVSWYRIIGIDMKMTKGIGKKTVDLMLADPESANKKVIRLREIYDSFIANLPGSGNLVEPFIDLLDIPTNIEEFILGCESSDQLIESVALAEDRSKNDNKDRVIISTMHGAKGLEWSDVYIVDVYDGNIPHERNENLHEEARLFYVAMTRAKHFLSINYPTNLGTVGKGKFLQPAIVSRFIKQANVTDEGIKTTNNRSISVKKMDLPVISPKEYKAIFGACKKKQIPNTLIKKAIEITEQRMKYKKDIKPVGYCIAVAMKLVDTITTTSHSKQIDIFDAVGDPDKQVIVPDDLRENL